MILFVALLSVSGASDQEPATSSAAPQPKLQLRLTATSAPNKKAGGQKRQINLREAMELALKNNPSVKNIAESVYQAEVTAQKAWAILLPNLSADGSVTHYDDEVIIEFPDFTDPTAPPNQITIQERWGQHIGFTANTTLFTARAIPLLQNAYDFIDFARDNADHQRSLFLLSVAAAFYQVHTTRELVAVAGESLKNADEFLRMSIAQEGVGQGTRIDVLRAKIQKMDAEKQLAAAKDTQALSKTVLSTLIGLEEDFDVAHDEKPEPIADELVTLTKRAHGDRLDVRAARLNQVIAERKKIDTWLKWVPNFDVTFGWSWDSAAGFGGNQSSWRVIFGARWQILEGSLRIAEAREAASNARVAANNVEQLTLDIDQQVERLFLEVQKSRRNIKITSEQERLAEENHNLVNKQYEVGLATSLDVLNATTQLTSARVNRVLEDFTYELAVLNLNQAVGELLVAP